MKQLLLLLLLAGATSRAFSQITLTQAPSGGNKKATVAERIGLTDVTVHYDRPGVKGREGKIWGQLVPPGFVDPGFGSSKATPWRAGANENTTIEFSADVKIEGRPLKKGKYGFFIAYDPNESTIIFSNNAASWGSYYYNESEDALRVKVKPVPVAASALMKEALPLANMQEVHAYGRSLLAQKKAKEALDVFQMNYKKNPAQFTTLMGLTRGLSANGDYKNALKYATQALPLAPDAANKASVTAMMEKLKKGEDVN